MNPTHQAFMFEAIAEARAGASVGGIPIGSILAVDGKRVSGGHNQRVQRASPVLHAEMDCLEKAGRLEATDYRHSVLYSTLSPCDMCSGAILLYGIPHVVVGENINFQGPENYLRERGVVVDVLNDSQCIEMMRSFIDQQPSLWFEDIGR
jgi:cytosine deaminase